MNRMTAMSHLSFLLFCLFSFNLVSQDTLVISDHSYGIDHTKRLILINEEIDVIQPISGLQLSDYFQFDESVDSLAIGVPYTVSANNGEQYQLYFTELPIVTIIPQAEIVDEPRRLANFAMTEGDGKRTVHDIGIEYRGGFSQSFDKKSLRIEFWNDPYGDDTENFSLLGMRSDDDWNLQAMYNEPMRLRNKSAFDLWRQIDTLYYQVEESKAINGVHYRYVEVFINDDYRGVYGLSERIDRKQLRLKKNDDEETRGELYKGIWWDDAVLFRGAPLYDNSVDTWSGWEHQYPDEVNWSTLHQAVTFLVDEEEQVFQDSIGDLFDIANLVNYFIFLNVTRAEDNTGKNTYLAKYDADEPFFYVPWDLDGVFGMRWDGIRWRVTDDILSNGLYDRLLNDRREDGFIAQLKQRWTMLRRQIITVENIDEIMNANFTYLSDNGIYERERIAWPNTELLDENTGTYTRDWLYERIRYLDQAFENLDVITNNEETSTLFEFDVNPNPSFGIVTILSDKKINEIQVFTESGSLVKEAYGDDISQIDLRSTLQGIYFIKVVNETGEAGIRKLVIK